MTSRPPAKGRLTISPESKGGALPPRQLADPDARQTQHFGEQRFVERRTFGGGLDLDNAPRSGQHEIGIGHRLRVFGIIEVEHDAPAMTPHETAATVSLSG